MPGFFYIEGMEKKKGLYFIGIVPPSPIREDAQALKQHFQEHYHSAAALRSPPHITLHMPFVFPLEKEDALGKKLNIFFASFPPFEIQLDNFGCFPPKVIFLQVAESKSLRFLFSSLHQYFKEKLNIFNAAYHNLPFHPHLTLAFRDLKKLQFKNAWESFSKKTYRASFKVVKVSLLKHDGKEWKIYQEFFLTANAKGV